MGLTITNLKCSKCNQDIGLDVETLKKLEKAYNESLEEDIIGAKKAFAQDFVDDFIKQVKRRGKNPSRNTVIWNLKQAANIAVNSARVEHIPSKETELKKAVGNSISTFASRVYANLPISEHERDYIIPTTRAIFRKGILRIYLENKIPFPDTFFIGRDSWRRELTELRTELGPNR